MADFGGATFKTKGDGTFFPVLGAKADYIIRPLAGGGQDVSFSSQVERALTVPVLVTPAELTALRAKVGTVATFTPLATGYANTLLETIDNVRYFIGVYFTCDLHVTVGVTSHQQIAVGVNINGDTISGVLSVATACGMTQGVSNATVNCTSKPSSYAEGAQIDIYMDVGSGAVAIYKGKVEQGSYDYYPGVFTLTALGQMQRLAQPWGSTIERVYSLAGSNGDDGGIITNFIEAWGGSMYSSHSIDSSGHTFGQIQPIVVKQGDIFTDWIRRLDEVTGYITWDNFDGATYRRRMDPTAHGSSVATFTQGGNILKVARRQDTSGIINDAIVEGLTYEGVENKAEYKTTSSILDAYAPATAPNYRSLSLKSDLIEDPTYALTVATRIVSDRNRRGDGLEITIPLNPAIVPNCTVTVTAGSVGASGALLMVDTVKHSIDGPTGTTVFTTFVGTL